MQDHPETDPSRPRQARWEGADAYERYMGRWSRAVARDFSVWMNAASCQRWLDVGCGTGALTAQILASDRSAPSEVWGIDASAAFVDSARSSLRDSRAHFDTGTAEDLPFQDGTFDVVVSGLLINFVPEPALAVREMARVARPGGVVACYVWDYLEEMQMLRYFWDALLAQAPAAAELDEVRRFAICRPERLRTLFRGEGLQDIEVEAIDVQTRFRDFDDYWSPFLAGKGAAPSHLMSLPESDRSAIEKTLRSTLPCNPDQSIELRARAWAIRGRVPS